MRTVWYGILWLVALTALTACTPSFPSEKGPDSGPDLGAPKAWLTLASAEPAGENCPYGGYKIESGLDNDGDGILDPEEVTQTEYVCNGLSCWDLDANGVCDIDTEDINGDEKCDAIDCKGDTGVQGEKGDKGDKGDQFFCWDLDEDLECTKSADPDTNEDKNEDGFCTPDDCTGSTGDQGPLCWDLDLDKECDLDTEDVNGDGLCTSAGDCKGDVGPGCWDLNGNALCDAAEDRNNDSNCTALDCMAWCENTSIRYVVCSVTGQEEPGEQRQVCVDNAWINEGSCYLDTDKVRLIVTIEPANTGAVDTLPGPDTFGKFNRWTTVTLYPEPVDGYYFGGWEGPNGAEVDAQDRIYLDDAKEVTARFVADCPAGQYPVVLSVSPADGGAASFTTTPNTAPNCFTPKQVTLATTPAAGWKFSGWGGPNGDQVQGSVIYVNELKYLTAIFEPEDVFYSIYVASVPAGGGAVSFDPEPDAVSGGFTEGMVVSLVTEPAAGFKFVRWEGADAALVSSNDIEVTRDMYLTAVWEPTSPVWTYGGPGDQEARSVREVTTGGQYDGFVIGGCSTTLGYGWRDFYALEINRSGGKRWEYAWGTSEDECLGDIRQTADGFIYAGTRGTRTIFGRMDADGDRLFERDFGDSNETADGVIATSDGNYLVFSHRTVSWDEGVVVRKVTPSNEVLWNRGFSDTVTGLGMVETADGYIYTASRGTEILFARLYPGTGDVAEENSFDPFGRALTVTRLEKVTADSSGDLLVSGRYCEDTNCYATKGMFLRITKTGTLFFARQLSAESSVHAFTTTSSSYANGGTRYESDGLIDRDHYLMKSGSYGSGETGTAAGGEAYEYAYDMSEIHDEAAGLLEGYLIAGTTLSYGKGGTDIYLSRYQTDGTAVPYAPCASGYPLHLAWYPRASGTVNVSPASADGCYAAETVVTLTPVPARDDLKTRWIGDPLDDNGDGTFSLTMNGPREVTAVFDLLFTLEITVQPAGYGTVTLSPVSADNTYYNGASVTMTPVPAAGKEFKYFASADGSYVYSPLKMDSNKYITAVFGDPAEPCPDASLAVTVSPVGSGTVALAPAPDAGTACFDTGTVVTMTPTAAAGWTFSYWDGPSRGQVSDNGDDTYDITVIEKREVTAVFTREKYKLTVTVVPSWGGTVTQIPSPDGSGNYGVGTVVNLVPTPRKDFAFVGWEGTDAADVADNAITMDAAKTLTARFVQLTLPGRLYGGAAAEELFALIQTKEAADIYDGFAFAGYTKSFGAQGADAWVVKLDGNGALVWERILGGPFDDVFYGMKQLIDGGSGDPTGYILAGRYGDPLYDNYGRLYLVKLDNDGNTVFERSYPVSYPSYGESAEAYDIIVNAAGNFVITGQYFDDYNNTYQNALIAEFDGATGDPVASRLFKATPNGSYDYYHGLRVFEDTTPGSEGYYVGGQRSYSNNAERRIMLARTAHDLSAVEWATIIDPFSYTYNDRYNYLLDMEPANDGGWLFGGGMSYYTAGGYVIKSAVDGTVDWATTMSDEFVSGVFEFADGFDLTGFTTKHTGGGWDAMFVETGLYALDRSFANYGGAYDEYGFTSNRQRSHSGASIAVKNDSGAQTGYLVATPTRSYGAGDLDVYLLWLGTTGTPLSKGCPAGEAELRIVTLPIGGGSVDTAPAATQGDCYPLNTDIDLTATPAGGLLFAGYTVRLGDAMSDADTVRLTGRTEITARFALSGGILPATNLQGEYLFSGNATDTSGNGRNGIVSNAVLAPDRDDTADSAYQFNGTNAYIDLTNAQWFNYQDFSISFWVNPAATQVNYATILDNYGGYNWSIDQVGSTLNRYQFRALYDDPWDWSYSYFDLPADAWSHVVVTHEGPMIRVYVNGVMVSDLIMNDYDIYYSNYYLRVGHSRYYSNRYFTGRIDDLRMYNRVLTDDEIGALRAE